MLSKISISAEAFNAGFISSSVPSVSFKKRKEALTYKNWENHEKRISCLSKILFN